MKRVSLIGCGHISRAHLGGWARVPNCEVVGVFDTNPELAASRAAAFGIPRVFPDLDAALGDSDILDICTPPQTHLEIAAQAFAAGHRLVIEKPVVTSWKEWGELTGRASVEDGTITAIHNFKFLHSVQKARRWIDSGVIGDVISVRHEFLVSPRNDRMLAKPHWSHALPGGRWQETLPHPLYLTHFLAGPLTMEAVSVVPGAVPGARAGEVAVLVRGDRAWGTFAFSSTCEQKRLMVEVQGSAGRIVIDWLADLVSLDRVRDSRVTRALGRTTREAATVAVRAGVDRIAWTKRHLAGQTPHATILRALGSHLAGEGPAPTPLGEIEYVIRNCDVIGREIDRLCDVAAGGSAK